MKLRAGLPASRCAASGSQISPASFSIFEFPLAALRARSSRLVTVSRSFRHSSVVTVAMSPTGSTRFSTWTTFGSSKQRATWTMASTSRIWARNWLPRPSPFEAPRTSPAMSTNWITVGTIFSACTMPSSAASRSSGTVTTPTFGSMVQNG